MGIPGRLNSEDAANNVQSCCTCKIRAHTLSQTHSQQPWFWKSKEFYWLELKTQSPSLSVDELKLSEPSTDSQDIILPQWPASIGLISYSNLFSQFHACCKPRAKLAVDVFGTTKRWMALNNKTNLHWNGLRHCTQHLEIYEHLIHLYFMPTTSWAHQCWAALLVAVISFLQSTKTMPKSRLWTQRKTMISSVFKRWNRLPMKSKTLVDTRMGTHTHSIRPLCCPKPEDETSFVNTAVLTMSGDSPSDLIHCSSFRIGENLWDVQNWRCWRTIYVFKCPEMQISKTARRRTQPSSESAEL